MTMNRTLLFGLAALFFMVVAALADCPNNCSGRGVCVNRSVCQCYTNWAGADCSYEDVALGHGQSISGSVAVDAWVFGHLQINGHSSIAWNVVQGVGGDCDIYIEKDIYPTRSKWLQRDISTKTNVTLVTPDATHGKWYVGIYGFAACTFQLTAHIYGECPRNCTNNGVCVNGVCSCNSGHTGPDCSEINPISLPLNTESQSATVPRNGWMYYTVPHVQPSTLLHFTLTQTIAGEDADLYLQVGGFPNFTSFLVRNTTTLLVSTLDYAYNPSNYNPPVYVGVYGFTAATFKLAVHAATAPGGDCATVSKCSLHGTCRGQSCSCSSAYHGANCEYKRNPIGLGQWESGYVADALWNYYTIGASSGLHELRVLLTESARAGGDCDLYVRAGGYPTSTSFDYFDVTAPGPSGGQSSLTIPSAALEGQAWYIGVYGFSSCAYNLTVTEVMKNNTQCGVHGSPNSDGTCVCRDYYAGANCEIPTTQLQKGVVANGTVAYNKWAYYHIKTPVNGTHAIQAHLAALEDYAEGDLWFYASMDGWPTLRAYDKSDTRVGVTIHSISYVASSQPFVSQDVFIGVFAGPYSQQTNTFSLVAWYPDF